MSMEILFLFATFTVLGVLIGFLAWVIHRLDSQNTRQAEMLMNYATFGRAQKPTAEVYDPGPIDDETRALHEVRNRAIDRATAYLAEEGQVSTERARAEAEALIAAFEARGQVE